MYSPSTTEPQVKAASKQLGFKLRYHTADEISSNNLILSDVLDRDTGKLRRQLTAFERRYIINEQNLCKLDYLYWLENYHHIIDWEGNVVTMKPNIAQQIILDCKAEMEQKRLPIMLINLKARQLGITTEGIADVGHRVQFHKNVMAIVGSSTPYKSEEMYQKMIFSWDHQPWWLVPQVLVDRRGEAALRRFADVDSTLSVQHGAKVNADVGRGQTPSCAHLSEISEWLNPYNDIDAALRNAMHEHENMLLQLESTARGMSGYWFDTWNYAIEHFNDQYEPSDLYPVFLPWYVGRDIYPTEVWLRKHPVPINWTPTSYVVRHAERAAKYVSNSKLLKRYLGSNWRMPREQMWYYEVRYGEAKKLDKLNLFLQEMCVAGNSRISTDEGIIPISDVSNSMPTQSENGHIIRWIDNGEKPTLRLTTKQGRLLQATPDHRVALADGSWKEMQNLVSGDKLQLSPPMFVSDDDVGYFIGTWTVAPCCQFHVTVDETMARFIGYFMGDGCYHSNRVEVACTAKDKDVVDDVYKVITEIIGSEPQVKTRGGLALVVSSNVRWHDILWNLGCLERKFSPSLKRNSGYRRKVRVPECILRSKKAVIREFLSALFECDAHAYTKSAATRFFSKYEDFSQDIQLLLLGFGINAIVRSTAKTAGDGHTYTGREMQLNAIASDLFHKRIGFISARKRAGKRRDPRKINTKPHEMFDYVASVVDAGTCRVYDLSIAGSRSFGAGGILVHNCGDEMEAFQTQGHSIFDAEIISNYHNATTEPKATFMLDGPADEIRPELKPDLRWVDSNKRPIPIDGKYQLVPMRLNGWPDKNPDCRIYIWELPKPEVEYGFGVDTAQGIGLDSTNIEGIRKADFKNVAAQVCEFNSNRINAVDIIPYLHVLGRMYSVSVKGQRRQPRMVIETMSGGDTTQLGMRKLGWNNFHAWLRYDRVNIDQSKVHVLGTVTTQWSRDMILSWLIASLRDLQFDIFSPWFVQEMRTLCKDENRQRIAGEFNSHDDRIMSMAWVYLSMHILESGEFRSPFGKSRIAMEQSPLEAPQYPKWKASLSMTPIKAPNYDISPPSDELVNALAWKAPVTYPSRPPSPLPTPPDWRTP